MVSKYVKKHQNQRLYFDTVNSSIPAIYIIKISLNFSTLNNKNEA